MLVLPVLLEQVLGLSVGFTDKWLAGNLLEGAEPLAAVGLVAYCLSFLPGLFAIPAVAATALVSRCVGAGDLRGARRAAAQTLLVAAILTAAVVCLMMVCGQRCVQALGLPPGSTALASRYLAIVLPALPAMMIIRVGVAVLRGAGDMWAGLLAMSVVNLVNAVASFALAAGAVGLPRMGWEGLAWGTTLGYCLGAGCVIGLLCRRKRGLRPSRADWSPDGSWLTRILHVAMALLMVISGGLRGAGATRVPLAALLAWDSITLSAGMGTIPGLGLAAIGAWYAMAADLTVRGLAMLIIFTRKDWSRVRV